MGLANPRGFIIVDKHQRNPKFPNVFGVGVCIAIAPVEQTPLPVGVPKTGFMIESMVTATALNIGQLVRGEPATHEATWNAICLADFGDSGVAFVAMPQNPPRNVNWASSGRWVHVAKVAFEKYFLHKVRAGTTEPYYEKAVMRFSISARSNARRRNVVRESRPLALDLAIASWLLSHEGDVALFLALRFRHGVCGCAGA